MLGRCRLLACGVYEQPASGSFRACSTRSRRSRSGTLPIRTLSACGRYRHRGGGGYYRVLSARASNGFPGNGDQRRRLANPVSKRSGPGPGQQTGTGTPHRSATRSPRLMRRARRCARPQETAGPKPARKRQGPSFQGPTAAVGQRAPSCRSNGAPDNGPAGAADGVPVPDLRSGDAFGGGRGPPHRGPGNIKESEGKQSPAAVAQSEFHTKSPPFRLTTSRATVIVVAHVEIRIVGARPIRARAHKRTYGPNRARRPGHPAGPTGAVGPGNDRRAGTLTGRRNGEPRPGAVQDIRPVPRRTVTGAPRHRRAPAGTHVLCGGAPDGGGC